MSTIDNPPGVETVSARQLESELRAGAPIVVVDVREPEAFAEWSIPSGDARLTNVPLSALEADLDGAIAAIAAPHGAELRAVCNRGRNSLTAATLLGSRGLHTASVDGGMIAWSRILTSEEVPAVDGAAIVQFRREARGCLSYLVVAGMFVLVVDPGPDVSAYLDEADRMGVTITHILDTHVHADHLSGMRDLASATGATMILSTGAFLRGADTPAAVAVGHGDVLTDEPVEVRILELPGHTSDNVGVLVGGKALIAGDSLFADSVARPDLEVGDAGALDAARRLHRTLHERVLPLGDDVLLLPCHYEGGRVDESITPTLGDVRRNVVLLGLDEDAFAHEVIAAMPPRPCNYLEIIAANMGRPTTDDVAGLEVGANNCAATVTRS